MQPPTSSKFSTMVDFIWLCIERCRCCCCCGMTHLPALSSRVVFFWPPLTYEQARRCMQLCRRIQVSFCGRSAGAGGTCQWLSAKCETIIIGRHQSPREQRHCGAHRAAA